VKRLLLVWHSQFGGTAQMAAAARDAAAARLIAQAARLERSLSEAVAPLPLDAATIGRIVAGAGPARRDANLFFTPRLAALAGAATVVLFLAGFSAALLAPPAEDGAYAALLFGGMDDSGEWL